MCEYKYAPGSHDLVIGIKLCDDPECPQREATVTRIDVKEHRRAEAIKRAEERGYVDRWKPQQ